MSLEQCSKQYLIQNLYRLTLLALIQVLNLTFFFYVSCFFFLSCSYIYIYMNEFSYVKNIHELIIY